MSSILDEVYYDEIAESYDELHFDEQKRKAELILKELRISKEDKLLDVGCGTGKVTELFPCKVTGVDPSRELLKKAKIMVVQGVAEALTFSDKSFDVVISLTVIHHTLFEKAISEMRRVAKRDIVISVLKKAMSFKSIDSAIRKMLIVGKVVEERHDVIYFCKQNL
ncbi:class I SAM-dependent methyltransferase [Candidatus Woesearchaeota archaeon]|nr:class I SAM-dependent methyltransferase [Candidatus Woesearchaeota archaeon]